MKKTDFSERKSFGKWLNVYLVTTLAFIVFAYVMLAVKNSYMLRWYDEMSLFESTRFFFRQCLYFPGGLMRYAGAWLTQLMYYPILGSSVIILLWLLMAWLTQKAFCLPRIAFPLAFIVPIAMLVSIVQMDDAWVSMKSVGYIYSNTLGYLFVVVAVWAFRNVENRQWLAAILLLITAGCYFIAGFYALFASLIGVFFLVAGSIKDKKYLGLLYSAVIITAIIVIPHLYYQYFQPTTVDNDLLYLKGLPDLLMEKFDKYLWLPFEVATAFLLLLAIISAFKGIPSSKWMLWLSVGALCLSGIWCMHSDKKNEQLRATVLMLHHLENNNWKGILSVMSNIKEPPNYTMCALKNLAIENLGGVPEDIKDMKPRQIDARHSEKFTATAFINVPVNYYDGKFNTSYQWGMEHCVQYRKRVFYLKYMVKDALLNGEIELAKRYNDILLRTIFHRRWAEDINRYIEDPSLIETNPEFKSILGIKSE
ncbi:MAG: hypothetical protein K2I08_00740 [Muribaculaceae bacterium]|nr:hypothetical protein [Muribaculaceae bacterium]